MDLDNVNDIELLRNLVKRNMVQMNKYKDIKSFA